MARAKVLDSPLAGINPTIKVAILIVASIVIMFVLDPVTPAVLYVIALVGVITAGRLPARTLALAHIPFLGFGFGIFTVNMLSRPGTVLWQEGFLRITTEGISIGLALALRTLLIGVLAIGFVMSTDAVKLMTSLHQTARLGARPTYAVMSGYRLLEQLAAEWTIIRRAQQVRAPLNAQGRARGGPGAFGRATVSLLVVAVRRGEQLAQSLESRGLGLSPRTVWRPVPVTRVDAAFGVLALVVLGSVIGVAGLAGVLQGPGSMF